MEKYDIYKDISARTNGDIYIGVVGPVRTGKSTFITKFMEKLVLPNISNKFQKQIATDEMPQSAEGRTIMTTQPKFVPANSVKVQFKNKATANVRLIDCVGYFVDGAFGNEEDDKPRLVKTPWSDKEMTLESAAEFGTKKVINEYSTIGILVTTDGSIGEIGRENYASAEEKIVEELKNTSKPFVIVLNSKNPQSEQTLNLSQNLEDKYGVPVITVNAVEMQEGDINSIMEKILMEFPVNGFHVNIPKWMRALPQNSKIICEITEKLKNCSLNMTKMRDFSEIGEVFSDSEEFNPLSLKELKLDEGTPIYDLSAKEGLFFKVISDECGEEINDDYTLMSYIKDFSEAKKKFSKIKDALNDAETNGYGVVFPTVDEMELEEPSIVKKNGRYGVKLKASAPSLHIMKVNVETEVSPIVGSEKQGEDMANFIMNKFEDNPAGLWNTDMFGKPLHDLVNEGLSGKLNNMPIDARNKMRKTVSRIVNENRGGVICILL